MHPFGGSFMSVSMSHGHEFHQSPIIELHESPYDQSRTACGFERSQPASFRELDLAVQARWPRRHSCVYSTVRVLMMSWAQDDLRVEREMQVLESVFRQAYHFDVEHWKIPGEWSRRHATKKVIEFVETVDCPDTLLVFYYAGHAMPNLHQPGGCPIWFANRAPNSPRLDSTCLQSHFCEGHEYSPDVLLLYDTCHPANGYGPVQPSRNVVELLAACGFESRAPEPGHHSFTHSLIQELSDAARFDACVSVPELHRRLLNRALAWKPEVVIVDHQGVVQIHTMDGSPIFETPLRRTPFHCHLSLNPQPRSIVLSPMPKTTLPHNLAFVDLGLAAERGPSMGDASLQMVLRLDLELSKELGEVELRDWLCSAPASVRGLKVLGSVPCSSPPPPIPPPVQSGHEDPVAGRGTAPIRMQECGDASRPAARLLALARFVVATISIRFPVWIVLYALATLATGRGFPVAAAALMILIKDSPGPSKGPVLSPTPLSKAEGQKMENAKA